MNQGQIIKQLLAERIQLLGYIHAIVRDAHMAEDIYQELTVAAMESDSIQSPEHLKGWARKTAQYKSMEAMRKRRRGAMMLDADVLELCGAAWDALDPLESQEQLEELADCIDQLTPRARRLIRLKYVEGLSGKQIAESVSNNLTSVYGALSRIHNTLNECMARKQTTSA
jgi:RNA polymerase sigma-70 factor (ECF subfamily)